MRAHTCIFVVPLHCMLGILLNTADVVNLYFLVLFLDTLPFNALRHSLTVLRSIDDV